MSEAWEVIIQRDTMREAVRLADRLEELIGESVEVRRVNPDAHPE